jgi:hypothetical protein
MIIFIKVLGVLGEPHSSFLSQRKAKKYLGAYDLLIGSLLVRTRLENYPMIGH